MKSQQSQMMELYYGLLQKVRGIALDKLVPDILLGKGQIEDEFQNLNDMGLLLEVVHA